MNKKNAPCKMCHKERLIDVSKITVVKYLLRSPNCHKCATKLPALQLCKPCHAKYDKNTWGLATKKFNLV